ncbi:MAG: VOC family protein, partial [Acidimicrobiales bacterium]
MAFESPLTIGIDHVGLTVADLDPTVAFFLGALGWEIIGEDPDYPAIYLSDGTTKVTLWQAWAEDPVPADREANVGLHHLALRVPSPDALDDV